MLIFRLMAEVVDVFVRGAGGAVYGDELDFPGAILSLDSDEAAQASSLCVADDAMGGDWVF